MARQPTLKQLRYLSAVAEHGHFGNAAKACHVSQSTLSAGVLELEDEFAGIAGAAAMADLAATLQTIFRGLNLDPDQFDQRETVDLNLLAQQLKQQLGDIRSQALGQLLVNSN